MIDPIEFKEHCKRVDLMCKDVELIKDNIIGAPLKNIPSILEKQKSMDARLTKIEKRSFIGVLKTIATFLFK
jgi:hypothetical protein